MVVVVVVRGSGGGSLQGVLDNSKVPTWWELSLIRAVQQCEAVCMHTKWFSANYLGDSGDENTTLLNASISIYQVLISR